MKHVSLSKFDGSDKKKGCEIVECCCVLLTRNCCMRFVVTLFLVDDSFVKRNSLWLLLCLCKSLDNSKVLISLVESRHIVVNNEWNTWLPKVLVFSFLFLDTFLVKEVFWQEYNNENVCVEEWQITNTICYIQILKKQPTIVLLHNKNCWVYISFHKKSLHICSHCCFCCQIDNSVKTSSCQFCIFTRIFSLWQEIISFQQDSFHNALPLLIIVDKKCIIVVCFFVYYSSCSLSHILFNNKSFLWNHLLFTDSTLYPQHFSFSFLFFTFHNFSCQSVFNNNTIKRNTHFSTHTFSFPFLNSYLPHHILSFSPSIIHIPWKKHSHNLHLITSPLYTQQSFPFQDLP